MQHPTPPPTLFPYTTLFRSADLPRDVIRRRAVERFSPSRMTDEYEAVYARLLAEDAQRHMSARPDARDGHLAEGERSEEHTSELQSRLHLVCRLLLEKKKKR